MKEHRTPSSIVSRAWSEDDVLCEASDVGTPVATQANIGNARILLAASHRLRQPLQTLSLLHGILAQKLTDPKNLAVINKLDDAVDAMSRMLNTFLDIADLETDEVHPKNEPFPIDLVLQKLRKEFTYRAASKGLSLEVVASSLSVKSDPHLLRQMMRALLSDAIKCTDGKRLLLGCRRSTAGVRIELWDGGADPRTGQLEMRFDELSHPPWHEEYEWDMILDLSYARRIGEALGHKLETRTGAGNGPIFTIEVLQGDATVSAQRRFPRATTEMAPERSGTILIVENDAVVRDALELLLTGEGHRVTAVADAAEVAALLREGALSPDVIIADYDLSRRKTGLEVIKSLRHALHRHIPAIVLSSGFTTETLRMVTAEGCAYLRKPTDMEQLTRQIESLLSALIPQEPRAVSEPAARTNQGPPLTIFVVDDDVALLGSMRDMLQQQGQAIELHTSAESFLSAYRPQCKGCLIVDSRLPGISGTELIQRLKSENRNLPAIMITGNGDMSMAVKAMKAGALDFLEKPVKRAALLESINIALAEVRDAAKRSRAGARAAANLAALSPRMREVMNLVVAGAPNKKIAGKLNINQRTVESHRAAMMKRLGVASLPELVRLVMRAAESPADTDTIKNAKGLGQ